MRTCPVCKNQYDDGGDSWKKVCYDCYKNYKGYKRIDTVSYKNNQVYITHPSVTKEELDNWIKERAKEGQGISGWGVEEYKPSENKWKIWTDYTNFD